MIAVKGLTKSFGKFRALDNISLELSRGSAVSLLGPNGSGKTTLIKSILGLVRPQSGTITVLGEQVKTDFRYRSHIGYMPQIGRYPENMTIRQVISMIKEIRKDVTSYDEDLYHGFGIPSLEHKTMRSLSGGTRQKVSACLAFLFRPDIYILDEPTAGLDPVSSELMKEKIREQSDKGKLILMTSHVLSDLENLTTHVIYLQEGKVIMYKSVDELRDMSGESRLDKIISVIISDTLQPAVV